MRLLVTSLLITFAAAQKKPLDPALTEIFGPPPGLETGSDLYKQEIVNIFGPPPISTDSDPFKNEIISVFGKPPSTDPESDPFKNEIISVFGKPPSTDPIEELTLPPAVWDFIFGTDEEEVTENPEKISPSTNVTSNSSIDAIETTSPMTTISEISITVPDITSPSPVPATTSIQNGKPNNIQSELNKIFGPPPKAGYNVTPDPLKIELEKVFGKPPGLEKIEVQPTETPATFVGQDGAPCKCLPYYLCDRDHMGVYMNDTEITGYGVLDVRFGEVGNVTRKCQETVEICCTVPKNPETIVTPAPPTLKGCGYRNTKGVDFTITGGSGGEAEYGEFPWVVALMDSSNGSLVGVGAIIHPQVIITGAHVASKFAPGTFRVRAGEWDTSTVKERLPYQEREVQEIFIHSDFHPKSLRNDLALLRLPEPLKLAEHINMICLPDQDESFDNGVGCIANGWGKDVFGVKGRYAVILKKVLLNMVSYNRCSSLLKATRLGPNFVLHPSFVCAGGEEGKDTCTGDGGAPLSCPIGNDRFKLTGLVAWGIGCGLKGVPAVYAGVSNFRSLIDEKMNQWGYGTSTYSI